MGHNSRKIINHSQQKKWLISQFTSQVNLLGVGSRNVLSKPYEKYASMYI